MATGWVKSLQCKSRAVDDVVHHHLIPTSTSCRFQTLMDVVQTGKKKPKQKRKSKTHKPPPPPPVRQPGPTSDIRLGTSTRHPPAAGPCFPALTELPEGHASRNVVEIIFHTSWSQKTFPGRVDMVFKVQNMPRTVTRFEEYREVVKSSAGLENDDVAGPCEDLSRCLADGNEVMRFYCLGPAAREVGSEYTGWGPGRNQHLAQTASGPATAWGFTSGKGAAICTFSGSGIAHDSAGGGRGRRAMLVCRVIAGRVGFDSVSGEKGELLVYDTRALLPCFLIIYKV